MSFRFGKIITLILPKGICWVLWKVKIWFEWRWASIIIKTESQIYTGCMMDRDPLFSFLYLIEIYLHYHWMGSIGAWGLCFFREERSNSINLQRYEMTEDFV